MNIPIYRAKKIDSDEYVIGFYSSAYDVHHYIITHLGVDTKVNVVFKMSTDIHKIDPTTLAIHFPDMLDGQGNKFFASLSEDGKGGDIIHRDGMTFKTIYKSVNGRFEAYEINGMHHLLAHKFHQTKIIGIQQ